MTSSAFEPKPRAIRIPRSLHADLTGRSRSCHRSPECPERLPGEVQLKDNALGGAGGRRHGRASAADPGRGRRPRDPGDPARAPRGRRISRGDRTGRAAGDRGLPRSEPRPDGPRPRDAGPRRVGCPRAVAGARAFAPGAPPQRAWRGSPAGPLPGVHPRLPLQASSSRGVPGNVPAGPGHGGPGGALHPGSPEGQPTPAHRRSDAPDRGGKAVHPGHPDRPQPEGLPDGARGIPGRGHSCPRPGAGPRLRPPEPGRPCPVAAGPARRLPRGRGPPGRRRGESTPPGGPARSAGIDQSLTVQSARSGSDHATAAATGTTRLVYSRASRKSPTWEKRPKKTVPKAATIRPMLYEKPAPVVRRRVGKSGGRNIVYSPKTPEKNPTRGNQSCTSDSCPRGTAKAQTIERKEPRVMAAMALR